MQIRQDIAAVYVGGERGGTHGTSEADWGKKERILSSSHGDLKKKGVKCTVTKSFPKRHWGRKNWVEVGTRGYIVKIS